MNTPENPPEPLVVERVFDAPVEVLWHALTNADEMRRWYFDLEQFKPEPGFEFRFTVEHEGTSFHHCCRVTEAVPLKKIAYTWRYEGHPGDSLVTFELLPENGKARLKLTHEGLETFPVLPPFARNNFVKGWNSLIGASLVDYVKEFGREITVTREFHAPREMVWEAMTDPRHVVNWWGPRGFSTRIEKMEFREGGVWKQVMTGPDGARYFNKSVFKEIVKPERIVYAHSGGREGGSGVAFTATWTFEALAPDRTRLTMRLSAPSQEDRDFVATKFGAIEGGRQTLERLGEHLARRLSEPFVISREFDAPLEMVWKAWTERERLQQWFGPEGFRMIAAELDFRPGGRFLYGLVSPEGKEIWGKFVYREITPPEKLVWVNSFSDKDGGITRHPFSEEKWPLQMLSEAVFSERDGKTTVTLTWLPLDSTEEDRRTFAGARDSMNRGWTGTFNQLAGYLGGECG